MGFQGVLEGRISHFDCEVHLPADGDDRGALLPENPRQPSAARRDAGDAGRFGAGGRFDDAGQALQRECEKDKLHRPAVLSGVHPSDAVLAGTLEQSMQLANQSCSIIYAGLARFKETRKSHQKNR